MENSKVLSIKKVEGSTHIILEETVFYPQGGGQPYDQGLVWNANSSFIVEAVYKTPEGIVHQGHFKKGCFEIGEYVQLQIDAERRELNSRLHSAGHLIDYVIQERALGWKPVKGYHYPDGAYVEYEGELSSEVEGLRKLLEEGVGEKIALNLQTRTEFLGEGLRKVWFGEEYGVPCGGTHVAQLQDIGSVEIRKIRCKKGRIQVAYLVAKKSKAALY